MKESLNGVMYNGRFCPVGGGLHWNATTDFYRGGLKDLSRALKCDDSAAVVTEETKDMALIFRIRKLTPKTCFRLMGLNDLDIAKIQNFPLRWNGADFVPPPDLADKPAKELQKQTISESQQYKLAGNSIVVQVLEGIFTQMFRADETSLF